MWNLVSAQTMSRISLTMFIQFVESNGEYKVILEMLNICRWSNKVALRKLDGESVLRGEMV